MSDEPEIGLPGPAAPKRARWNPTAQELKQIVARHRGWLANLLGEPLREHDRYLEDVEPAYPDWLDEARSHPEQADLSDANLSGANLNGALLPAAELSHADLSGANLSGANLVKAKLFDASLRGANLSGANLSDANLGDASLSDANLSGADLSDANLSDAFLHDADMTGADLSGADLSDADMTAADLSGANLSGAKLWSAELVSATLVRAKLSGADLWSANLSEANLSGADLSGAHLERVRLVSTNLEGATISDCRVYGISAWDVRTDGSTKQLNLIVTPEDQEDKPDISVDDLEVAQFIYLLIDNPKIQRVIETITSKAVLILGRFTKKRKQVLDALREELRKRGYVPILFDFEKPSGRDLTGTITLLANMARFIIADLTEPRSIPHELYAIVPELRNVPVQSLLLSGTETYAMFDDLLAYQWVLPTYRYTSIDRLLDTLAQSVIEPAEAKLIELKAQLTERSRK